MDVLSDTLVRGNTRKTKPFLIATQHNTIKTNYIFVKIDNTQWNSQCRLCGEKKSNEGIPLMNAGIQYKSSIKRG